MKLVPLPFIFASAVAIGGLAAASASVSAQTSTQAVYRADEVTLQLVVGERGPNGVRRGALLVDLAPGWKTYWIDPGAAGLPPVIDFSPSEAVEATNLHFPAPRRFGEGLAQSNGYTAPMAVAFELRQEEAHPASDVTAIVRLGVCQTICIPVGVELTAAPDPASASAIDAAFAALPAADAGLGRILQAKFDDAATTLTVEAEWHGDPGAETDLFVTGPEGWYFDEPSRVARYGKRVTFQIPVAERPKEAAGPPDAIDLVMVGGNDALQALDVTVED